MPAKERILTSTTKVRFQDCDPFNHLNNLKYIEYFINAREDQLLDYYDLDIYEYAKQNTEAWVVAANKIAYLRSAVQMEKVLIESQLIDYSNRSLQVEMRMWDQARSQLKSLMWINFAYIDIKTTRPVRHPDNMMDLFTEIHAPVEQKSFDERCIFFRRQK